MPANNYRHLNDHAVAFSDCVTAMLVKSVANELASWSRDKKESIL
jgi:hypothetical protein